MQKVAQNTRSCQLLPSNMWKALTPQVRSDVTAEPLLERWKENIQSKVVAQLTHFTVKCDPTRGSRDLLMLDTSEQPLRGGDRNERTAQAGSNGKEVKTTSKNSLTNRPYSR